MFNILVCIKQVLDPEAPASSYKVDIDTNKIVMAGVPPVMSPFDENALEAALRIKDSNESKITVMSYGRSLSRAVLTKALAVGADELVIIERECFKELDSFNAANTLAAAIKNVGNFDLILTGRQAADTNAGITGPGIATMLGIPYVVEARKIQVDGDVVTIEKTLPDGYNVVQLPLPCLVTICSELGELRTATLPQIVAAKKKPVVVLHPEETETDNSKISYMSKLYIPEIVSKCEFVKGESDQEKGIGLAEKLRDSGLLPSSHG
ncbi:MAG: hypothetical protein A2Z02_02210 [Chloroflexi bacterium RBG_16_48_7]|nr:MAG: hypothetical protein A2Z02_02210 [Chloroflexi bacterium RBG_16_48_7]